MSEVVSNGSSSSPSSLVPKQHVVPSLNQLLNPLHSSNQLNYKSNSSRGTIDVAIECEKHAYTASLDHDQMKNYEAHRIAFAIYQNSYKKISFKKYADFLGQRENNVILSEYISLLKPLPLSLASVLISLSSKIYLIAEAQNIDRILEKISKEWVSEYPLTLWGSNYEIVHIILFSILLLNSDLHNVQVIGGKKDKFSSKTFVDNTLYAIKKALSKQYEPLDIEKIKVEATDEFTSYFELLKNNPLPLFSGHKANKSRRSSSNLSRNSSLRSVHLRPLNSRNEEGDTDSTLPITLSPSSRSESLSMSNSLSRTTSVSSRKTDSSIFSKSTASWKYKHNMPLPQLYIKENFDENLNRKNNTMWLMDSIIDINENNLHKLTNKYKKNQASKTNSNSKKDTNTFSVSVTSSYSSKSDTKSIFRRLKRSKEKTLYQDSGEFMSYLDNSSKWVSARIRISEGRIFIFQMAPNRKHIMSTNASNNKHKSFNDFSSNRIFSTGSTISLPLSGTSKEKKNTSDPSCLVFNLFECTAELLQENIITGNQSKKANFTLTFPKNLNGIEIALAFETSDFEEARRYVECLNFWAGRLSPVPVEQLEIVSNEEYGWSARVVNNTKLNVEELNNLRLCDWRPLLTMELFYDHMDEIPGKMPLFDKLEELKIFTSKLDQLIDEHNDLKPIIMKFWQQSTRFDKVMDNWNAKYLFLNNQYKKRMIYLTNLEQSLKHIPI